MSCVTCGGSPCFCKTANSLCLQCGGSPCCCGANTDCSPILRATPAPFYQSAQACPEDHSTVNNYQQFYTALKAQNSWNVPICGGASNLYVDGLKNLLIGSYLWSTSFGYFQVLSFDPDTGLIVVQNNCTDGNAAIGTQVPGCSNFIVAPPPASVTNGQTNLFPYVAIDFTAPANGDCIDITVTTVNGLISGKNIQIGSGTYTLTSIGPNNVINICNNGLGIAPGTPVIAKNAAGDYQYPVITVDANPCTNPAVTQGSIIVCHSDLSQPLHGDVVGAVPVLQDATTNEVKFEVLDIEDRLCTILTADVTLVPAQTTYVFTVVSSAGFVNGNIIQLDSRVERFTITSVIDATHIQANIIAPAGAIVIVTAGTSLCIIRCCEQIQTSLDALVKACNEAASTVIAPTTVASGGIITGNTANITVQNTSPLKSMCVYYTYKFMFEGSFNDAPLNPPHWGLLGVAAVYGTSTAPIGTAPAPVQTSHEVLAVNVIVTQAGDAEWGTVMTIPHPAVIPPLNELKIAAHGLMDYVTGNATSFTGTQCDVQISYIAVAI